jgi:hypothetical protein
VDAPLAAVHRRRVSDLVRELLEQLLRVEIDIAARVAARDATRMGTAEAVRALHDFGLAATQREPLVETDFDLADPLLQALLGRLCERYGAGVERKGRRRAITVTAPRTFIAQALGPMMERMAEHVLAWQQARRATLLTMLEESAPLRRSRGDGGP